MPRPPSKLAQKEFALEELRAIYLRLNQSSDILDQKSRALFQSSSVIVTLFGGYQIYSQQSTFIGTLLVSASIVLVLYGIELFILMYIARPQVYKLPFVPGWEGVNKAILGKATYEESVMQMIANYIARIEQNSNINTQKADGLQVANLIFLVNLIIIAVLIFA